eukprot:CAMPEP_0184066852 /NCGR_PEP_ID=MMETSP0957-20130417/3781_1 /TAXON_ID=627963 /ORGANISM="Aplanochytrium sp, Strain PBS07" /LENGTH=254 /DNA_ID=CAMNT_0026365061 /DNA_START=209 /DNA_END=976 /DNA_ORIENTATION=-
MSDRAQQYFAAVIPENWEDAQDRINSGVDTARKLLNNKDHRVQRQVEEFVDSVSGPDLVHTKTFTRAAKEAFKEVDINSDGTVDAAEFYAGMLVLYHKINQIPWGGRKPPPKRKYIMLLFERHLEEQQALGIDLDGLTEETFINLCRQHFAEVAGSVLGRIVLVAVVFPFIGIWLKTFLLAIPGLQKIFQPVAPLIPSFVVSLFVFLLPYGEDLAVRRVLADKNGFARLGKESSRRRSKASEELEDEVVEQDDS